MYCIRVSSEEGLKMSAGEWGWEISMVINKEIRYTYSIHRFIIIIYNVKH
jgi:hypothetical protein